MHTSSYYQQQCLSFLMAGKCSGEILTLPEHKHIEILDWGGLWKVDRNATLIFKVAECHFKAITSVQTTKIDCKSILFTLMKILLSMKICPKSEVNQLIQLLKKKSP